MHSVIAAQEDVTAKVQNMQPSWWYMDCFVVPRPLLNSSWDLSFRLRIKIIVVPAWPIFGSPNPLRTLFSDSQSYVHVEPKLVGMSVDPLYSESRRCNVHYNGTKTREDINHPSLLRQKRCPWNTAKDILSMAEASGRGSVRSWKRDKERPLGLWRRSSDQWFGCLTEWLSTRLCE